MRKKTVKTKEVKEIHYCDECLFGSYDYQHKNLNYKGEPILIICDEPHHKERTKAKEFTGTLACNYFKIKNNDKI